MESLHFEIFDTFTGGISPNWQNVIGARGISYHDPNAANYDPLGDGSVEIYNVPISSTNMFVRFTHYFSDNFINGAISVNENFFGVRCSNIPDVLGNGKFYFAGLTHAPGNPPELPTAKIFRYQAGGSVLLASRVIAFIPAPSAVIEIRAVSNTITLLINGLPAVSGFDSTYTGNMYVGGTFLNGSGAFFDNFLAGSVIVTSNTINNINREIFDLIPEIGKFLS